MKYFVIILCIFTFLINEIRCSEKQASSGILHGTIQENSQGNQSVNFKDPILSTINGQQVCTYKLESKIEGSTNPFSVELMNRTTGLAIITLNDGEILDYEVTNGYSLILTAEYCGGPIQTSKQEVIIDVLDVNEYPPDWTIPSYVVILEEGKMHDNILTVKAVDRDESADYGTVCEYHLITPDVPFVLNKTGVMRNTEPLDYSSRHNYILEVVAVDCGGLKSESIFVNILIKKSCVAGWTGYQKNILYKMSSHKPSLLFPKNSASLNLCDVSNCSIEQVSVSLKLGKTHDDNNGNKSINDKEDYEISSEIDKACDMDDASVKRRISTCDLTDDTVEILTPQHIKQLINMNTPTTNTTTTTGNNNKDNNNSNNNKNINSTTNNNNNNGKNDNDANDYNHNDNAGYYFNGRTAYDVINIKDITDDDDETDNSSKTFKNDDDDNDNDKKDNGKSNGNDNDKKNDDSSSFLMTKSGPRSRFTISTWLKRSMMEGLDGNNNKQSILCSSDADGMSRSRISLYLHNCHLVMLARFEPSKDRENEEGNLRRRRKRKRRSIIDGPGNNNVNNSKNDDGDINGNNNVDNNNNKNNVNVIKNYKDSDINNNNSRVVVKVDNNDDNADSKEWISYDQKKISDDNHDNNDNNENYSNNNDDDEEEVEDDDDVFYRHSEWHWKLEEVCDSKWHHYSVMVDQDVARLFVDGNLFPDTPRNPFIIDDRALHNSKKVHGTKLTVGACWKGLTNSYGDYLRGRLVGLLLSRKSARSTFSEQVVRCLNNCNEKLDFHSINQMESGMSISMNSQMTELTINGRAKESVEHLISRVAYVNPRLVTSSTSSSSSLSVVVFQTSVKCREEAVPRQLASNSLKISFSNGDDDDGYINDDGDDNIIEDVSSNTLYISGTERLDLNEEEVRKGVQLFRDVLIYSFHPDKSFEELEKENYLQNEVHSCKIKIFPEMNDDSDSLIYSYALIHTQHLMVNYSGQEVVVIGPSKIGDFVNVLHEIYYVHVRPEEINEKTFQLLCYRGKLHTPSQQLTVQLNVIHYDYDNNISGDDGDDINNYKADNMGHNKLYHHLPNMDGNKNTKSGQGTSLVVATVIVCAGMLLVIISVGTYRMVTNRPKTVRVHVDNEQDLQWDKSTITITVNPLENATSPGEDDDDDEDENDDDDNDVGGDDDDYENNNMRVSNEYVDDDDIGSAHEMMKDDDDDDGEETDGNGDDEDVSKINHLIISDTE